MTAQDVESEKLESASSDFSPSVFFATLGFRRVLHKLTRELKTGVSVNQVVDKLTVGRMPKAERELAVSTASTYAGILINAKIVEKRGDGFAIGLTDRGRKSLLWAGPPCAAGTSLKSYAAEMMRCGADHFGLVTPREALLPRSALRPRIVAARVMYACYVAGGNPYWLGQHFGIDNQQVWDHIDDWEENMLRYSKVIK